MDEKVQKPAAETTADRKPGDIIALAFSKMYLFVVFAIIIVIGALVSPYFLAVRNLVNIITAASITSVLAVGQFFVIVTGGIDLSVGSLALCRQSYQRSSWQTTNLRPWQLS